MKKIFMMALIISGLLLSSCDSSKVTCGEGLELIDGVCKVKDVVDDTPDDTEEPVEQEVCKVSLSDYQAENYELVWNDEFDGEGELDSTKWEYMIGNGGSYGIPGWGNNELQYYSNTFQNVYVENGQLRITASTTGYAQYNYTSGRVRSKDLADFQYGVFEICAKLPTTLGTWPAIWMLPTNSPYGGWPNGGEIDIMEAVGFESNTIHFNIHTENDNWGSSKSIGHSSYVKNIGDEYHVYGLKWTDESIAFYVDGIERFVYTPTSYEAKYWPFDTEFHLLLNIAVGGTWGGQRGVQQGQWEDSMYIDYVRVYQQKGE